MNKSIKTKLDNPHSINADVTQKAIYDEINGLAEGQFIKIEYRKIAKKADKRRIAKDLVAKIQEMSVSDLSSDKAFKVIDKMLSNYHGETTTGYYKKPAANDSKLDGIRNASGYILLQDDNDEWKSVELKNVLNLTNSDGVKLVRHVG